MKTVVAIAMLAFAATAEAAYCRDSSYALPCETVDQHKQELYKACGVAVTVTGKVQKDACCVYSQQVADEATWQTQYSACEKDPKNDANYGPLKAASAACAANQKSAACRLRR